jgi:hypothetical protein
VENRFQSLPFECKLQRYAADESMEQVRFIPPHNGEPELCGGAGQVEFS